MKYACLSKGIYRTGAFSIIAFRDCDILLIKKWRNEQMDVLRQDHLLTDEEQINYYTNHVFPTFAEYKPRQILFSILYENKCKGYGGLTNIDWNSKRTELSFLIDTNILRDYKEYEKIFSIFIDLMKLVVFDDLQFNKIFTETYDIREFHVSILEKNGFVLEGRLRQQNFINDKFVDSLFHGILMEDFLEKSK